MVWDAAWRLGLPGAQFTGVKAVTDLLPDAGALTAITAALEATKAGNWQAASAVYDFAVDAGAQGPLSIFTVTGDVILQVFGVCQANMTGAGATISLGVTGALETFIPITTGADLIANELWHDATPTTTVEAVDVYSKTLIVGGGQDIIMTIATANLTAGKINFYCFWKPLSANGAVAAA